MSSKGFGEVCEKCKKEEEGETFFDGWYFLCAKCLRIVSPGTYESLKAKGRIKQ